jgi:hypothetical protein
MLQSTLAVSLHAPDQHTRLSIIPSAKVYDIHDLLVRSLSWVMLRARWVTLRARWVTLRARGVTLRARWVTLRARWVTLRARWVTLRARWVTLRARWVTLRARWVTLRVAWVTLRARWVTLRARWVTLRVAWVTLRARWVTLRARWVTFRARWVTLRVAWFDVQMDCQRYFEATGRRVTFEYTLLAGVNDSPAQATALAKLLRKFHVASHVNLIPWNPVDEVSPPSLPPSLSLPLPASGRREICTPDETPKPNIGDQRELAVSRRLREQPTHRSRCSYES